MHALHQAALREAVEGGGEEAFWVEPGGGGLKERGERVIQGFVEPVFELGRWGRLSGHGGSVSHSGECGYGEG